MTEPAPIRPHTARPSLPPAARERARRLCALAERDRQLAREQNTAHERFADAAEQLVAGAYPEALRAILGPARAHRALRANPLHAHGPTTTAAASSVMAGELQAAFIDYHDLADRRRRVAVEADEQTVELVRELVAAGWSEHEAREADIRHLADPRGQAGQP